MLRISGKTGWSSVIVCRLDNHFRFHRPPGFGVIHFFLPGGPYWISATLLGLELRNYGGEPVDLRTEPRDDAPVAGTVTEEAAEVTPLDVTKDFEWVKVRWGQIEGWVRSEMLCDNPVSNCC